jgi:hypothetical protein
MSVPYPSFPMTRVRKKFGMAQMSEKFKALGEQVYVEAEKVKESHKGV